MMKTLFVKRIIDRAATRWPNFDTDRQKPILRSERLKVRETRRSASGGQRSNHTGNESLKNTASKTGEPSTNAVQENPMTDWCGAGGILPATTLPIAIKWDEEGQKWRKRTLIINDPLADCDSLWLCANGFGLGAAS